jgi:hypothetical protein
MLELAGVVDMKEMAVLRSEVGVMREEMAALRTGGGTNAMLIAGVLSSSSVPAGILRDDYIAMTKLLRTAERFSTGESKDSLIAQASHSLIGGVLGIGSHDPIGEISISAEHTVAPSGATKSSDIERVAESMLAGQVNHAGEVKNYKMLHKWPGKEALRARWGTFYSSPAHLAHLIPLLMLWRTTAKRQLMPGRAKSGGSTLLALYARRREFTVLEKLEMQNHRQVELLDRMCDAMVALFSYALRVTESPMETEVAKVFVKRSGVFTWAQVKAKLDEIFRRVFAIRTEWERDRQTGVLAQLAYLEELADKEFVVGDIDSMSLHSVTVARSVTSEAASQKAALGSLEKKFSALQVAQNNASAKLETRVKTTETKAANLVSGGAVFSQQVHALNSRVVELQKQLGKKVDKNINKQQLQIKDGAAKPTP